MASHPAATRRYRQGLRTLRYLRQTQPKFALIEVEGGYIVEKFNPEHHLSELGYAPCGTHLFSSMEEVLGLKNEILN